MDAVSARYGLYTLAHDTGCKGITYYRAGSRDAVLTALADDHSVQRSLPLDACPGCGGPLMHQEGCKSCEPCGISFC